MAVSDFTHLLDRIGIRPLMLLASIIAGTALGIQAWMWTHGGDYAPLYSGLSDRDAARVTDALGAAGINYRLAANGAIEVPSDKLRETRLKMASEALPQAGPVGMEMLQKDQGFGVSQFVENARYQVAQETELARTIMTLQSVRAARVHLAMGRESAFARDNRKASASVLLELYPGRSLSPGQVDAIVHLVSASVADLPADAVTVVDQSGRLLSHNGGNSAMMRTNEQFDQVRTLENSYVQRIEQLLTPLTGPGRVSAQVAADMDFSQSEQAREIYNPDGKTLRSEQLSEKVTQAGSTHDGGVPGASANTPASAAQAKGKTGGGVGLENRSRSESRNFEVDRTVSHTREAPGRLRRLSVAVLVDNLPYKNAKGEVQLQPLSKAQLAQIEALVKEAVGFNAKRGDSVVVTNQPFLRTTSEPLPEQKLWEKPWVWSVGKQTLGVLVLLVIGFGVLRPAMRGLMQSTPAARLQPALAEGVAPAQVSEAPRSGQVVPYEEKLALVRGAVAQDPKRVAQVVRTWVAKDE